MKSRITTIISVNSLILSLCFILVPFLVLAISSYPQLHSVHYFISISLSILPSFQVVRLYMSWHCFKALWLNAPVFCLLSISFFAHFSCIPFLFGWMRHAVPCACGIVLSVCQCGEMAVKWRILFNEMAEWFLRWNGNTLKKKKLYWSFLPTQSLAFGYFELISLSLLWNNGHRAPLNPSIIIYIAFSLPFIYLLSFFVGAYFIRNYSLSNHFSVQWYYWKLSYRSVILLIVCPIISLVWFWHVRMPQA